MSNKEQKIIEIHRIVNMHEAYPEDTHFLIPNSFDAILMLYWQLPGG